MDVQYHQAKYARQGSGRPVKKRIGEIAQRDRQKQVMKKKDFALRARCFIIQVLLAAYDDSTLKEMKKKAEKLQDFSQVDIDQHLNLWKETLYVRRQYISQNSTSDIITTFPGYSYPVLVR